MKPLTYRHKLHGFAFIIEREPGSDDEPLVFMGEGRGWEVGGVA